MPYKVKVTVVKVEGRCVQGHKVDDEIIFDGPIIKGRLCPTMLSSSYPMINAMRFGTRFPFSETDKSNILACPDAENPVWFKLELAGLTSEPFYYDAEMKLLEKIKEKPGIKVDELLDEFTKEEKKEYSLKPQRIRVYLDELAETKQIELRNGRAYP